MNLLPEGTHVVLRSELRATDDGRTIPVGSAGVIESAPTDGAHSYLIRFPNGYTATAKRTQVSVRKHSYDEDLEEQGAQFLADFDLNEHVILRCVVGSRAYGLDTEHSDTDSRGVYLPPASLHWSIYGVPEQLENKATDECYWELQKFLVLALKANPNILECLYTPLVASSTAIGDELIEARSCFISKLAYRTYGGYVLSQFKRIEQGLRSTGEVRWKHVMHILRLLMSGIELLDTGNLRVEVREKRDFLLDVKQGAVPWEVVARERDQLLRQFEESYGSTRVPERPDYQRANDFLIRARFQAAQIDANSTRPR